MLFFFFNDTATTEIYTLSLHDALPISVHEETVGLSREVAALVSDGNEKHEAYLAAREKADRSEEHTSELQSRLHLVCRLLLEKKKKPPSVFIKYYTSPLSEPTLIRNSY